VNQNSLETLGLSLSKRGSELIRKLAASTPLVDLILVETTPEEFERKVMSMRPNLLIVDYNPENQIQLDLLERLRISAPWAKVIALSRSREPDHIINAIRLGVREYLVVDQELGQNFKEAMVRLNMPGQNGASTRGRIIAVTGAKGGVGTSHLALNLAWSLSQDQAHRSVLMDLDLFGGNQAFMLDVTPDKDISLVSRNFDQMDDVFLESLLVEITPGLRFLAAPEDPAEAETIKPDHVLAVLGRLARNHSFVILDLGDGLEDTTLAALDKAERILMVFEPNLVGLKAAARMGSLLDRLGHEKGKLWPVVNRTNSRKAITSGQIQAALNRPVAAWLPNEYPTITEASDSGRPLLRIKPKSKWGQGLRQLAEKVAQWQGEEE
jgi:pilus assembly protein CpaE